MSTNKRKKSIIEILIKYWFFITICWLIFKTKRFFIDCHFRKLTIIFVDSRSFSLIYDYFRWFTIIFVDSHRFDDFILFIRYFDEQFIRNKKFEKCQLISQNSKRKILLCWKCENNFVIVITINKKIRIKNLQSSQIDRFYFFLFVNRLRI